MKISLRVWEPYLGDKVKVSFSKEVMLKQNLKRSRSSQGKNAPGEVTGQCEGCDQRARPACETKKRSDWQKDGQGSREWRGGTRDQGVDPQRFPRRSGRGSRGRQMRRLKIRKNQSSLSILVCRHLVERVSESGCQWLVTGRPSEGFAGAWGEGQGRLYRVNG